MRTFPIRALRVDFNSFFHPGHTGIDVFAREGSDVVAVDDGQVRHAVEPKGGNAVYLTTSDGTQYFYGHLRNFAVPMILEEERLNIEAERRFVKAGELLGSVGTTGSARGRQPHVHFELRPQGKDKVDPFPALKRVAANRMKTPASAGNIGASLAVLGVAGLIFWGTIRKVKR